MDRQGLHADDAEAGGGDPLGHARAQLARWCGDLRRVGLDVGPPPSVAAAPGLISRYDFDGRCIHLGLHREDDAASCLMVRYLEGLFGIGRAGLLALFRQLTPWSLAHEFAHHLRYRAGCWSGQPWREEMIAHHFARIAQQALAPAQRARLRVRLGRALSALAGRVGLAPDGYVDTYAELPLALAGVGLLGIDAARAVQAIARYDPGAAQRVLARLARGRFDLARRLADGAALRASFDQGREPPERQLYLHLGWIALALAVEEPDYPSHWLRLYLPDAIARDRATVACPPQSPWPQEWPTRWRAELAALAVPLHACEGDLVLPRDQRCEDVFAVLAGALAVETADGPGRIVGGACHAAAGRPVSLRADSADAVDSADSVDGAVHAAVWRGADLRLFALRHPGAVPVLRRWVRTVDGTMRLARLAGLDRQPADMPRGGLRPRAPNAARPPCPDSSAPADRAPS